MATTLDATYFATNPSPPWVLSADNEVYTLAVDVNATGNYGGGELFKLTGQNSEFDPNGHFIRYNGQDIKQATRSGNPTNRTDSDSEYEKPTQNVDPLGNNHEWENPQDGDDRAPEDTGGQVPNTETTTGAGQPQPFGGTTQTGSGGRY